MSFSIDILIWTVYFVSLYFSVFWLLTFLETTHLLKKPRATALKNYPHVSILIPAHNEEDCVERSVLSTINLDYPKDTYEIIVIDDGSTDTTYKKVQTLCKEHPETTIRLIRQRKQGKASALNHALQIAKGEFFACLDADSMVDRKALKEMLKTFEAHDEQLAIVTPCMRVEHPTTILQKFQRVEYILAIFIQHLMGYIDCIYVAPGPFSVYRTEVIRHLGGFEQGNLTEDQEIAYRVQKYHYQLKQCPTATVYTRAPHDIKGLYKQRNRWFKGSLTNLIKYRKLFFNARYGDFGLFQMPLNLLNFVLSVCSLILVAYFFVMPCITFLRHLILIRFDITPYLRETFTFSFNILSLDLGKIFMWYILLSITLLLFYNAHRAIKVRIREYGVWYLIPYFFMYYILLSCIAFIVMIELAVGKKQRW